VLIRSEYNYLTIPDLRRIVFDVRVTIVCIF